jgi:hypothetical protein
VLGRFVIILNDPSERLISSRDVTLMGDEFHYGRTILDGRDQGCPPI